jgi:hypothetical protein
MFRFLEVQRLGPYMPHIRFMVRVKASPSKDPFWITRVPHGDLEDAISSILGILGFEGEFDAWGFSGAYCLTDFHPSSRELDLVLAWVPSRGAIPTPNPVAPGSVEEFLRSALKDLYVDVVKWECQVVTPIREDRVELSIKGGA